MAPIVLPLGGLACEIPFQNQEEPRHDVGMFVLGPSLLVQNVDQQETNRVRNVTS